MERQRCQQSQGWNVNLTDQTEVEKSGLFSPDDEYFTPPVIVDAASTTTQLVQTTARSSSPTISEEEGEQEEEQEEEQQESIFHKYEYKSRTIKSHNGARKTILPLFPPRSALISMSREPRTAALNEPDGFLLCNVPKQLLTLEQYQRRQMNIYVPQFEIIPWDELKRTNYHSYMFTFYSNIYVKLSQQWHIDIPILHYNLARLHQIAMDHNFHFSTNDIPIALEFFLQMDVDLFHLKTCSFRQGQPRFITNKNGQKSYEGIFTIDEQSIEGRYGMTPCNRTSCLCCKRRSFNVQFIPKQIHSFLNRYQAILNGPVTCTTSNIIYALTCPCGQKDYVAHTNLPFVDCLEAHRREIVRTIYEFLIGDTNANLIELKPKSQETIADDTNWLYQHAARCPH